MRGRYQSEPWHAKHRGWQPITSSELHRRYQCRVSLLSRWPGSCPGAALSQLPQQEGNMTRGEERHKHKHRWNAKARGKRGDAYLFGLAESAWADYSSGFYYRLWSEHSKSKVRFRWQLVLPVQGPSVPCFTCTMGSCPTFSMVLPKLRQQIRHDVIDYKCCMCHLTMTVILGELPVFFLWCTVSCLLHHCRKALDCLVTVTQFFEAVFLPM